MSLKYLLWRPSFAGSWRSIGGEFLSEKAAHIYAQSDLCKKAHGDFTDYEITPSDQRPEPRPVVTRQWKPNGFFEGRPVFYTTACIETIRMHTPENSIINPILSCQNLPNELAN